jgi:hypothetical protein
MANRSVELAKECQRQYDNCLYTATTLYLWLRVLRGSKVFFTIAPIAFGSLGSWKMLTVSRDQQVVAFAAISSFLGGLLSTIYAALKLDAQIADAKSAAGELTSLRDSYRQAALVTSQGKFDDFQAEFNKLKSRQDKVRAMGLTPPEVLFWWAQRKVKAGDYHFDIDDAGSGTGDSRSGEE